MAQKTVTIIIDENGNSEVDLEGFAGNGCSKVFEDFRGSDKIKTERKKASFYNPAQTEKHTTTGRGRQAYDVSSWIRSCQPRQRPRTAGSALVSRLHAELP